MSRVLAAVIPKPHGAVELREFPEPALEHDSALLRVELSEVCGTDVHLQEGRLAGVPYPLIPGHVTVGRLEKIRGRMTDIQGQPFREGQRVTFLDVHGTCHACWYCLVAKAATRCPRRKVYGITYGTRDGLTGGWAEAMVLKPNTRCIDLGTVDAGRFMAGGCGMPTALHAVERADVAIGDTVVVLGSGPVGLSAVIFALMRGASTVLCIGGPQARLLTAQAVGAAHTLDIATHEDAARRDWVLHHTSGRGADVTIEATGSPVAVGQALRYTRDGGRVVIVGQYTDCGNVTLNPHEDINKKHLDVRGCWGSDFSHFHRCVQIMASPRQSAPWAHLELQRYPLGEAGAALAAVAAQEVVKALIDPAATA